MGQNTSSTLRNLHVSLWDYLVVYLFELQLSLFDRTTLYPSTIDVKVDSPSKKQVALLWWEFVPSEGGYLE